MSLIPQAGPATSTRVKSALFGMIGSFVLFAAYLAVPPIGIFSGLLAPFPAACNRLIHGRVSACIVILGATAAATAFFGIIAGGIYLGMCAVIGLLMPELLVRNFSGSRALFWTTAANLVVLTAGILLYSASTNVNLQQLIYAEITSSISQAAAIYEKSGVKGEELDLVKQTMKTVSELMFRLYPALITLMLAIMAGCNLALLKKTASVFGMSLNVGEFVAFRTPDLLVWVFISAGFAMLLPSTLATTPALNILLLVSLLYFVQGMAVVSMLISKQSISGVLRIVLYVMLLIQPYLMALVAIIGMCDLWVDFRTPKKQENL